MNRLEWNSAAVTTCLEVLPEITENGTRHTYQVAKQGLLLKLQIHQFQSAAELTLIRESSGRNITRLMIFIRDGIYHHNNGQEEYLLLKDCILAPDRFALMACGNPFDMNRFPRGHDMILAIDPDIRFERMPAPVSYVQ